MDQARATYLLNRYHVGACTPEEHAEFALLLHDPRFEALRNELLDGHWPREADADWQQAAPAGYWDVLATIKALPQATRTRRLPKWLPYVAAASILLLCTIGVTFYLNTVSDHETVLQSAYGDDVLPGGNRAMLTLADGRTIDLSETQTGIIVGDGIAYADGTDLAAEDSTLAGIVNLQSIIVNELALTTPKGGTYQITLSDGTKVWLNAASTLKYPSHFTGNERTVELEGEAYFEVSQQTTDISQTEKSLTSSVSGLVSRSVPFRVVSKGQRVEVLGTQFNISAYPDEAETNTTLIEGSVQILNLKSNIVNKLQPGEQAITRGAAIEINEVATEQYTAWKDGFFNFNGTNLQQAMRQLERWYDIQVDYEGGVPDNVTLRGKMERNLSLQTVLDILQRLNLKYRIADRRLTIINN